MKAVSYQGVRNMEVADHPKPKIKSPSDAILRAGHDERNLRQRSPHVRWANPSRRRDRSWP